MRIMYVLSFQGRVLSRSRQAQGPEFTEGHDAEHAEGTLQAEALRLDPWYLKDSPDRTLLVVKFPLAGGFPRRRSTGT